MTVFDWFKEEKGFYFYRHQKIGTAIAIIRPEEVRLLWPSSSNPRVRYKTLIFRIHGYDVACKPEKITPVTPVIKAPTVCEIFLTCKK